jgi:hypothetical protein
MPSGYIEPDVFLEHNGVTVYHTYKDDWYENGPLTYWFTLDESGDDFDIRDLDNYADAPTDEDVIKDAIDAGYFDTQLEELGVERIKPNAENSN